MRGGVVVQLGLLPPGSVPAPGNLLVTHEVDLLTQTVPVGDAREAFELAGDRTRASEVLLDLTA